MHTGIIQAQTLKHNRPDKHSAHTAAFYAVYGNRYKCRVYRFKPLQARLDFRGFYCACNPGYIPSCIEGDIFHRGKTSKILNCLSCPTHVIHQNLTNSTSHQQTISKPTQPQPLHPHNPISPYTPKPFYPKTIPPN